MRRYLIPAVSAIAMAGLALGCTAGTADRLTTATPPRQLQPAGMLQGFEESGALRGWTVSGDVVTDPGTGFTGGSSLRLARTLQRQEDATTVVSPAVQVVPGTWAVGCAMSADLHSPDNSYKLALMVDWIGKDGQELASRELANVYGRTAWQPFRSEVEAPAGAVGARLRVVLDKATGSCHVDDLELVFVSAEVKTPDLVERFTYSSPSACNLLLPTDRPVITTTVEAFRPLAGDQRRISWQLRDYWGAEIGAASTVTLGESGRNARDRFAYQADIDLAGAGLEEGKYYELHTRLELPGRDPVQDRTTLAILPEAPSKRHPPQAIPFTSRNWDHRMAMHPVLSDRIGLRVLGMWGGFTADEPGKTFMPQFENGEKNGMAMFTGVPSHAVENHVPGYEKWTVEAMRLGTRTMLETYAGRGLRYIGLGNEPPGLEERAREALPFYRAVYEEVKRFDPSIQVIGTSVGPCEGYFKAGFQDCLDVFDFHVYEDTTGIRAIFAEYERLFAKYNCRKPIVATELGLNSQGLPRIAITGDLVRKLSVFFALGGLHCSWFDLFYPDPTGVITGTNGDSFNAFNCKYECYSPRLDAIAYYNMINGILVKKCRGERLYPDGVLATLFADDQGACFMTIYTDGPRRDVFIPLPGTGAVRVTRIDGALATLDARGTGITLGVSQDPLLLSWQGGAAALPAELGVPVARLISPPAGVVKGAAVDITLALDGLAADAVAIAVPRGWSVDGPTAGTTMEGKPTATWTLTAPAVTTAREARVSVGLGGAGEITVGIPVIGQISMGLLPVVGRSAGVAGVKLVVRNNGRERQRVATRVSLLGEYVMDRNNFDPSKPKPTRAFIRDLPEATVEVEAGGEQVVELAMHGLDPQTIYRVRAVATDQGGIALTRERMLAGFASAPRAKAAPTIDGVLDEADWQRAQVLKLDEQRQFWGYDGRTWRGPSDLSGEMRVLWDDQFLYVAVRMVDDVFRNRKQGNEIWAGDGLQFLFDPCRASPEKVGKYDYGLGFGSAGPQAWCWYSADGTAPSGAVADIRFAAQSIPDGSGGRVYEVAFPWSRLAPFKPAVGRNLGMAMILNDDDGTGRDCYIGWFSGVSTKEVDVVGDIVLGD